MALFAYIISFGLIFVVSAGFAILFYLPAGRLVSEAPVSRAIEPPQVEGKRIKLGPGRIGPTPPINLDGLSWRPGDAAHKPLYDFLIPCIGPRINIRVALLYNVTEVTFPELRVKQIGIQSSNEDYTVLNVQGISSQIRACCNLKLQITRDLPDATPPKVIFSRNADWTFLVSVSTGFAISLSFLESEPMQICPRVVRLVYDSSIVKKFDITGFTTLGQFLRFAHTWLSRRYPSLLARLLSVEFSTLRTSVDSVNALFDNIFASQKSAAFVDPRPHIFNLTDQPSQPAAPSGPLLRAGLTSEPLNLSGLQWTPEKFEWHAQTIDMPIPSTGKTLKIEVEYALTHLSLPELWIEDAGLRGVDPGRLPIDFVVKGVNGTYLVGLALKVYGTLLNGQSSEGKDPTLEQRDLVIIDWEDSGLIGGPVSMDSSIGISIVRQADGRPSLRLDSAQFGSSSVGLPSRLTGFGAVGDTLRLVLERSREFQALAMCLGFDIPQRLWNTEHAALAALLDMAAQHVEAPGCTEALHSIYVEATRHLHRIEYDANLAEEVQRRLALDSLAERMSSLTAELILLTRVTGVWFHFVLACNTEFGNFPIPFSSVYTLRQLVQSSEGSWTRDLRTMGQASLDLFYKDNHVAIDGVILTHMAVPGFVAVNTALPEPGKEGVVILTCGVGFKASLRCDIKMWSESNDTFLGIMMKVAGAESRVQWRAEVTAGFGSNTPSLVAIISLSSDGLEYGLQSLSFSPLKIESRVWPMTRHPLGDIGDNFTRSSLDLVTRALEERISRAAQDWMEIFFGQLIIDQVVKASDRMDQAKRDAGLSFVTPDDRDT